jgi:hypothetical protein
MSPTRRLGGMGFVWRGTTARKGEGPDVSVPSLLGFAFRVSIDHVPDQCLSRCALLCHHRLESGYAGMNGCASQHRSSQTYWLYQRLLIAGPRFRQPSPLVLYSWGRESDRRICTDSL